MSYFDPSKLQKEVIPVKSRIKHESQNQSSCQEKTRCGRKFPTPYAIMNDSILIRECDNTILINWKVANIKSYEITDNKIIVAYFYDEESTKTALKGEDIFSINDALRTCIALHVGDTYYNRKGIENLAERLSCLKCIDRMLEELHKSYEKELDHYSEETSDSSPVEKQLVSISNCVTETRQSSKDTTDQESNETSSSSVDSTSERITKNCTPCKPLTIKRHIRRQFKDKEE